MSSGWINQFIPSVPLKKETPATAVPEKKPRDLGWFIWFTREEVEEAMRKKNEKIAPPTNKK